MTGSPDVYASSRLRVPAEPLLKLACGATEASGPRRWGAFLESPEHDLTVQHAAEPQGQRIVVAGRVLDEDGRPVPETLVEIWQANAAGRYRHSGDEHPAPLDPNFTGRGRCLTDEHGCYRFITVKPGAYPWKNHTNAWRPAHIHFSLFGRTFAQRLVTQMYFPDDPLFFQDPIFNAISDAAARRRLVASFSLEHTEPDRALGFVFDIVLRGPTATPMDAP